jgi:hypothetical protein
MCNPVFKVAIFVLFIGFVYAKEPSIDFYNIPLYFEKHQASDGSDYYISRQPELSFFIEKTQIAISFQNTSITLSFPNSSPNLLQPLLLQERKTSYFIGNNPSLWKTEIPSYKKVAYREIYPGIDLILYGNGNCLEYDFEVSPYADPTQIKMHIDGADFLYLNEEGALHIQKDQNDAILIGKPYIYQQINGEKKQIEGEFTLSSDMDLEFRLGPYEQTHTLVIDPTLSLAYSTYFGGSGSSNSGTDIAIDVLGSAYITGSTNSTDFPLQDPFQSMLNGTQSAFISKLSPDGQSIVYSTYLGGDNSSSGRAIAVDSSGSAYVIGNTTSTDFPLQDPFQSMLNGTQSAFISKLSSDGQSLLYSTYLGGDNSTSGNSIAIDSSGSAYVIGNTTSTDFPLQNPFQSMLNGTQNAFISKFSTDGQSLLYSTYLGGDNSTSGHSIAIDSSGSAYVIGNTTSTDFPLQNAFQPMPQSNANIFITKFAQDGQSLVYSTYFGGSGSTNTGNAIAVDPSGAAYITGQTNSTDFPVHNAFKPEGSGFNVYVSKFAPDGQSLSYSTYLGSGVPFDIAAGPSGSCIVVGNTTSSSFPTQDPFQGFTPVSNAFITKFSPTGQSLIYSTYLGGGSLTRAEGIALDSSETAHIVGSTNYASFPTQNALYPTRPSTSLNIFITKFNWSGDISPQNPSGSWTSNRFLSQKEWLNYLSWTPPLSKTIKSYRIYQNEDLTDLLQVLPKSANSTIIHGRDPCLSYTYYIVAVDEDGSISDPAIVTVPAK